MTNEIDPHAEPSGTGCLECDANGGWWFRLRRCAACGHIGCCASSPARFPRNPMIDVYQPWKRS